MTWHIQTYFGANVLLYGVIAIRTTLDPDAAAASLGLTLKSASARAEFLTAYGGLLLGVAAIFGFFAMSVDTYRIGLKLAVVFYCPILVYRLVPPIVRRGNYTFCTGAIAIELIFLIAGVVLLYFTSEP